MRSVNEHERAPYERGSGGGVLGGLDAEPVPIEKGEDHARRTRTCVTTSIETR